MPPCQIWCLWALRKRRHNAFVLSRSILWAHDQRCMWFGKRGPLKLNHNCVKFDSYKSCGMGYVIFFVTWHHVITWSKGLLTLSAGAPQPKSPLCQVWFLCVFRKWRYIVFILLRDITWPNDQQDMWMVSWSPSKSPPYQVLLL